MWPSDDSKLVTSKYGMRPHPILGYTTMHNGIDIGAHYGTNIRAADGGIVMISEYSSSYGNYVMINHGGGRYTLYAHMSKRLVSVGDKVSQGDVIGLVGSTGYSTGAHIHFEIQIDGKRTDPLQFFSDYTIWD
jgi:murein DD-endopeptidase MepM/ murein hydrolase activator NlpD